MLQYVLLSKTSICRECKYEKSLFHDFSKHKILRKKRNAAKKKQAMAFTLSAVIPWYEHTQIRPCCNCNEFGLDPIAAQRQAGIVGNIGNIGNTVNTVI